MKSVRSPKFKKMYKDLPTSIKLLAKKNYSLWKKNPLHPSLHYKSFGDDFKSVRIGDHYRAIGFVVDEYIVWDWIGSHEEYNKIFKLL